MDWAMTSHEGSYEVEAAVNNLDTQESASTSEVYQITSQVLRYAASPESYNQSAGRPIQCAAMPDR